MEVCGSDGAHVGTVDCMQDSNKIVLTRSDPKSGGHHHIIPLDWVDRIDDKVRLKKSAKDATSGRRLLEADCELIPVCGHRVASTRLMASNSAVAS